CLHSLHLISFNATATAEIYTLSLHDALPIWPGVLLPPRPTTGPLRSADPGPEPGRGSGPRRPSGSSRPTPGGPSPRRLAAVPTRSEEHTSELQSRENLVCRLLLEKKKPTRKI